MILYVFIIVFLKKNNFILLIFDLNIKKLNMFSTLEMSMVLGAQT